MLPQLALKKPYIIIYSYIYSLHDDKKPAMVLPLISLENKRSYKCPCSREGRQIIHKETESNQIKSDSDKDNEGNN